MRRIARRAQDVGQRDMGDYEGEGALMGRYKMMATTCSTELLPSSYHIISFKATRIEHDVVGTSGIEYTGQAMGTRSMYVLVSLMVPQIR